MAGFDPLFAALSTVLRQHCTGLAVRMDVPGNLYVEVPATATTGKPAFFAAVQVKKSYVSYHLMPVYTQPALLEGISEALRKRMHGKSCFRFTAGEPDVLAELDALTGRCAATLR